MGDCHIQCSDQDKIHAGHKRVANTLDKLISEAALLGDIIQVSLSHASLKIQNPYNTSSNQRLVHKKPKAKRDQQFIVRGSGIIALKVYVCIYNFQSLYDHFSVTVTCFFFA
jgi:hypothetical protein